MIENSVHFFDYINDRIDSPFFNNRFISLISRIKSISYEPLHKIVNFSSETWNQKDFFDEYFPYIEISAIDIRTGFITEIDNVSKANAPSRARKIIRNKDIVISMTRPNRGAISLINNMNNIFIASTGFAVIREINDEVLREYLYIVLRLNFSLIQMEQRSSGGNYPAITEDELKKILIPLPPKEIQQQIVDLYNHAVEEKQAKEQEAKELLTSIDEYLLKELGIVLPKKNISINNRFYEIKFAHLFGNRYDPYFHQPYFEKAFFEIEKTKYPIKPLKELSVLITSGITPLAGGDSYTSFNEGIPFVRSGDIDVDGNIDFKKLLYIKSSVHEGLMKSSKLIQNDILIAIVGATIGQVGIYKYECEANINQAIALVRLKEDISSNYVKEFMKSSIGQLNLDRLKRPVARANINLEEIASIQIVLPQIEKQNEIAEHIQSIRTKAKQLQEKATEGLEKAKREVERMIEKGNKNNN
jgi:type I restriction enzyme S subunit